MLLHWCKTALAPVCTQLCSPAAQGNYILFTLTNPRSFLDSCAYWCHYSMGSTTQLWSDLAAVVSAGITCRHCSALLLPLPNILASCWFCCLHLGPFWFSAMEDITVQSLNCWGLPCEAHSTGLYAMCSWDSVCVKHGGGLGMGGEKCGYRKDQFCQSTRGRRWKACHPAVLPRCMPQASPARTTSLSLFPSVYKDFLYSSRHGHCPSGLCSPLGSLQLAPVRFVSVIFNVKKDVWGVWASRCSW